VGSLGSLGLSDEDGSTGALSDGDPVGITEPVYDPDVITDVEEDTAGSVSLSGDVDGTDVRFPELD
jgi:hypothetical protein